jgi:hypothetical protein
MVRSTLGSCCRVDIVSVDCVLDSDTMYHQIVQMLITERWVVSLLAFSYLAALSVFVLLLSITPCFTVGLFRVFSPLTLQENDYVPTATSYTDGHLSGPSAHSLEPSALCGNRRLS